MFSHRRLYERISKGLYRIAAVFSVIWCMGVFIDQYSSMVPQVNNLYKKDGFYYTPNKNVLSRSCSNDIYSVDLDEPEGLDVSGFYLCIPAGTELESILKELDIPKDINAAYQQFRKSTWNKLIDIIFRSLIFVFSGSGLLFGSVWTILYIVRGFL